MIVPGRSDVDRVERELVARNGCVFGGSIGTFDDVFERIAYAGATRPLATDAQQQLALRRAVARASLNGLFCVRALRRVCRHAARGDPRAPGRAARARPCRGRPRAPVRVVPRRARHARRLGPRAPSRPRRLRGCGDSSTRGAASPSSPTASRTSPRAEWSLLEALAGRTDVAVSLPYEQGRTAFASLQRTAEDLADLADGRIEELPPAYGEVAPPALAYLERSLFEATRRRRAAARGRRLVPGGRGRPRCARARRRRAAPSRARRDGAGRDRRRLPVARSLARAARDGLPDARDSLCVRRPRAPRGDAVRARAARVAPVRVARRHACRPLRVPPLALLGPDPRACRLRGGAPARARRRRARADRGRSCRSSAARRSASSTRCGRGRRRSTPFARSRSRCCARRTGSSTRRSARAPRGDLRALERLPRLLDELGAWELRVGETVSADDVVATLERATDAAASAAEPGKVAVLDLERARTRTLRGRLRARARGGEPAAARRPGRRSSTTRLARSSAAGSSAPDQVSRDRYLFYTACSRPTRRLYLVRESATDEGSPKEASPFWDEVRALFPREEVERATTRRRLSELTWRLEDAPTDRERLRALASISRDHAAEADGDRPGERLGAPARPRAARGEPTNASASPTRARDTRRAHDLHVTELERMADCSSAWFVDRLARPEDDRRRGRPEAPRLGRAHRTAQVLRGAAEGARHRPRAARAGRRRRAPDAAVPRQGARGRAHGDDRRCSAASSTPSLWRDLEALVRFEADADAQLVPKRFEVSFGTERSPPELQRGLDLGDGLTLSGKIDRIDVDPFSARGIVQDYKSGKTAHSASADREGAPAPDPALHARAARPRGDRAARRRLPAARRRPEAARPAARRREGRGLAGYSSKGLPRRRRVLGARSRAPATTRAGWRGASAPATCGTTRAAASARRGATLWPMCRVRRP